LRSEFTIRFCVDCTKVQEVQEVQSVSQSVKMGIERPWNGKVVSSHAGRWSLDDGRTRRDGDD